MHHASNRPSISARTTPVLHSVQCRCRKSDIVQDREFNHLRIWREPRGRRDVTRTIQNGSIGLAALDYTFVTIRSVVMPTRVWPGGSRDQAGLALGL
jgi:hypothetical protein